MKTSPYGKRTHEQERVEKEDPHKKGEAEWMEEEGDDKGKGGWRWRGVHGEQWGGHAP